MAQPKEALKKGSKGPQVAELQAKLDRLCFATTAENGVFGEATAAAVMAVQRRAGLMPDGVVDGKTLKAVEEALKPAGRLRQLRDCFYCEVQEFKDELDGFLAQLDGYFPQHSYHGQLDSLDQLIARQELALGKFLAKLLERQSLPAGCLPPGPPKKGEEPVDRDPAPGRKPPAKVARGETPPQPERPPDGPGEPPGVPDVPVWEECCRQLGQVTQLKDWLHLEALRFATFSEREADPEIKADLHEDAAFAIAARFEAEKDHNALVEACFKLRCLDLEQEEKLLHSSNQTLAEFIGLLRSRVDLDREWLRTQRETLEGKSKLLCEFEGLIERAAGVLCKGEI